MDAVVVVGRLARVALAGMPWLGKGGQSCASSSLLWWLALSDIALSSGREWKERKREEREDVVVVVVVLVVAECERKRRELGALLDVCLLYRQEGGRKEAR